MIQGGLLRFLSKFFKMIGIKRYYLWIHLNEINNYYTE